MCYFQCFLVNISFSNSRFLQVVKTFPLSYGSWDRKKHVWRVAELLKPLVVQLKWQKGGSTIYESINYSGYIGVLTAVKKVR